MKKPTLPSRRNKWRFADYRGETLSGLITLYGPDATISADNEGYIEIEYRVNEQDIELEYQKDLEIYTRQLQEYNIWLQKHQSIIDEEVQLKQRLKDIQDQLKLST